MTTSGAGVQREIFAREILELQYAGRAGGYSQADITEFARAPHGMVGSRGGLPTPRARGEPEGPVPEDRPRRFEFGRPARRARRVVGRSYPSGGEEQGVAILRDLACRKPMAQHLATAGAPFRGDAGAGVGPAPGGHLSHGGDLGELARVLIDAPEAVTALLKFKTPWEWRSVSGAARPGPGEAPVPQAVQWLDQLGQPVWRPDRRPDGTDVRRAGRLPMR